MTVTSTTVSFVLKVAVVDCNALLESCFVDVSLSFKCSNLQSWTKALGTLTQFNKLSVFFY